MTVKVNEEEEKLELESLEDTFEQNDHNLDFVDKRVIISFISEKSMSFSRTKNPSMMNLTEGQETADKDISLLPTNLSEV